MTTLDWKALEPHVPLPPGASTYVHTRGWGAGDEITKWIGAGRAPLLLGGPAGVGKSTELARATERLYSIRTPCLVQLDRFENMRRLTPDRMLMRVAQALGALAEQFVLPLSPSLDKALENNQRVFRGDLLQQPISAIDLVNLATAEIARVTNTTVTLLIDGLEKTPEGPVALELFDALAAIRPSVELVVVVPWHAAFGPHSHSIIREGERFISARAFEVEGDAGEVGREVLREILDLRLNHGELSLEQSEIVAQAIWWSGGLPRVFLQLMADAGSYAKLRGDKSWPSHVDLRDAFADQVDSFRRLLLRGDADAIRAADGTSGSELELERKVRLMAHGVLLERHRKGSPVLSVHPCVKEAIGGGGWRA